MKKAVIFILSLLITTVTMAQNGYRIEIKQVFPRSSSVYSNAFNFKREMDNAISTQTAKLGDNANYQILITTPSGNETRNIQNITWVQIVNGVKSYHKKQTSPNRFYDAATIWEGYACNIDGTRKGKTEKRDFVYRVAFADNPSDYKTAFVDEETADAEALRLFGENAKDDCLVSVVVYKFEKNEPVEYDRKTNQEQYAAYEEHNKDEKTEKKKGEQQNVIQQQLDKFVADMAFVHANRDSLKIIGVHFCCEALGEASKIPDSLFLSQKLGSLYVSTLLDDVLPEDDKTARKARKKVRSEIEAISNESNQTRSKLYTYSKKIENILAKKKKWYQIF